MHTRAAIRARKNTRLGGKRSELCRGATVGANGGLEGERSMEVCELGRGEEGLLSGHCDDLVLEKGCTLDKLL